MFELTVALKYLLPRRRQLSVSIIALLSIFVIALVVWLLIVFLSVTRGIEQRWVKTLVALNAPLRLTPTDDYYNSYYYQIDRYSLAANYSERTLGEKLATSTADAYDPQLDPELPHSFPRATYDEQGMLLDPVKEAFTAAQGLVGFGAVRAHEFEISLANLRLRMLRREHKDPLGPRGIQQSFSNQASYIGTFDGGSQALTETVLPIRAQDVDFQLQILGLSSDNVRDEMPNRALYLPQKEQARRLQQFLSNVEILELRTPEGGWLLPPNLYPHEGTIQILPLEDRLVIPTLTNLTGEEVSLSFTSPPMSPLIVPGGVIMKAQLDPLSVAQAISPEELRFNVEFSLQNVPFVGSIPLSGLALEKVKRRDRFDAPPSHFPPWPVWIDHELVLPSDPDRGHGILLARPFQNQGVLAGDSGYLSYYAATPSGLAEQRLPVFVAGFYDPGLLPTGSRYILVGPAVTAAIRASVNQVEREKGNGIHVWISDLDRVDEAKEQLINRLKASGVLPYWRVETFKEYEFARPLVQQFESDRNLLSILAIIVITVACSNIISMLIVLVNNKRKEIGILRSMGATSTSIATIFATCGMIMGLTGSGLGIGAGLFTLSHLDGLIALLSKLQGHEAFQAAFYGTSLPNAVDHQVLLFVMLSTAAVSLLAGLVPAVKAASLQPTAVLRSE